MKVLIAAALAFLAAIFLLALRAPDIFVSPQMWAEDATIFWRDQYVSGWRAIALPYSGYFLAAPRITAFLSSFFDVARAPRLYALAAVLLTAWSVATATSSLRPPLLGFALGSSLMLAPHPGGEIFGNITNIQWLLAPTLALLLATPRADQTLVRMNQAVFATIAGLTGPFSTFLLPVAFIRLCKLRDAISIIAIVTGLVQLVLVFLHSHVAIQPDPVTLFHLARQMILRAFGPEIIHVFSAACLVVVSLLVPRHRPIRAALIFLSMATLIATFVKFHEHPRAFDGELNGPRYFYPTLVALLWCAVSLLFSNVAGAIVGATWLILTALTYPSGAFARPPLANMQWRLNTRELGERELTIPINPPGWTVIAPPQPQR